MSANHEPPEEALQNAPSGLARGRDTTAPEQEPLDPGQPYPADIRLKAENPCECHEHGFTRHELRPQGPAVFDIDRKSTRLNSSHTS